MTNPTMEKPSNPKDSQRNLSLFQEFENIEKQWESLKESMPRNPRRFSTGSNRGLASFDQVLDISPRVLMSSLQHRRSPSDGFLKVENWDMGVEEILRDRRAAIRSGKLRGRRLFGAVEGPSEVELDLNYDDGSGGEDGSEICNDPSNLIPVSEVVVNENTAAFEQSCSISDFPPLEEKVITDEKTTMMEVANKVEERAGGRALRVGGNGDCMRGLAWFAFIVLLFILGIIAMSCSGRVHENEVILVPT